MPDLRALASLVLLVLLVAVGFFFGADNADYVPLRFLGFSTAALPVGLWVLGMLLIGLGLGYAVSTGIGLRRRRERRRLQRELAAAQQEIEDLRGIIAERGDPGATEGDDASEAAPVNATEEALPSAPSSDDAPPRSAQSV